MQHWSNRGWDKNKSLWGGYAFRGRSRSFWFAGDTGYCPVFADIGTRLGPFDLAAIPIGAYAPRWFMKPQHCNPHEAVAIHQVGCLLYAFYRWLAGLLQARGLGPCGCEPAVHRMQMHWACEGGEEVSCAIELLAACGMHHPAPG